MIWFLIWELHFILGNGFVSTEYDDGGWDVNRNNVRGRGPRGRGRGRSFRGRGRGGYNGTPDIQQDGGYNQEAPFQSRGMCKYLMFILLLRATCVNRMVIWLMHQLSELKFSSFIYNARFIFLLSWISIKFLNGHAGVMILRKKEGCSYK